MAEQLTAASCWSGCQVTEHVEEVRRRQTEVMRLLPWLIADPLLVEALELMSLAVTELIEAPRRPARGRGAAGGDRELRTAGRGEA